VTPPLHYRDAGVDIDAGGDAVRRIKERVRSTYGPNVLTDLGSFGGVCTIPGGDPDLILGASVDGVGTKLKVAARLDRYDTIGEDLVNHCVGDIGVHGADPLFFLDYVAMGKLDPAFGGAGGGRRGARVPGERCALLGGETAEMPGIYTSIPHPGRLHRGRCAARTLSMDARSNRETCSSGSPRPVHTNGYSRVARLFDVAGSRGR
jgi:phosphoribosylformylglycinamidine cyclo-ligase